MDWFTVTTRYHSHTFAHECRLESLPKEWERELAALWRFSADIGNGGYLQFLGNWGRESYVYASQALHKIGATQSASLADQCQSLVDCHVSHAQRPSLSHLVEALPEDTLQAIYSLDEQLIFDPDDIEGLGKAYYARFLQVE